MSSCARRFLFFSFSFSFFSSSFFSSSFFFLDGPPFVGSTTAVAAFGLFWQRGDAVAGVVASAVAVVVAGAVVVVVSVVVAVLVVGVGLGAVVSVGVEVGAGAICASCFTMNRNMRSW